MNPGPRPSLWGDAGPAGTSDARLRHSGVGDTCCPRGLCPLFFSHRPGSHCAGCSLLALLEPRSPAGTGVCMSPPPWCMSLGTPKRVPTALVSPWPPCVPLWPHCTSPQPRCNSPEPLAMSPQPSVCVPCTCPHSPACPCSPPHGTGMWGAHRSPRPQRAASHRVGGPGYTQGVGEHPSHSPGPRRSPHTPASAQGPRWQQEWGRPPCFGARSPCVRGRNPVLDGLVSTAHGDAPRSWLRAGMGRGGGGCSTRGREAVGLRMGVRDPRPFSRGWAPWRQLSTLSPPRAAPQPRDTTLRASPGTSPSGPPIRPPARPCPAPSASFPPKTALNQCKRRGCRSPVSNQLRTLIQSLQQHKWGIPALSPHGHVLYPREASPCLDPAMCFLPPR